MVTLKPSTHSELFYVVSRMTIVRISCLEALVYTPMVSMENLPVLSHEHDATVDETLQLSLFSLPSLLPHNLSCLLGIQSYQEVVACGPGKD